MLIFQSNKERQHHESTSGPIPIIDNTCNNYTIVNQEEIRKKLNHLFSKNALLAIRVPGKFAASTLLTTIIHIEKNYIFLDGFQKERFNKDLLNQNTLIASANLEGIAVSFMLSEISGHNITGTFTLMTPLPQSMEWIQRRNARRVKVPINIPVKIQYKDQTDYFSVADISITGLSYIDHTEDHQFSIISGPHTDCNIILPDKSTHLACFEIVNNITIRYKHNKQINRVGCEIKRASYRLDTALQHLINKIDCHYQ